MTSKSLFQNNFDLRRLKVTNFANIIQIEQFSLKKAFNNLKNVKIIRDYLLQCNLFLNFLKYQNLLNSSENARGV